MAQTFNRSWIIENSKEIIEESEKKEYKIQLRKFIDNMQNDSDE